MNKKHIVLGILAHVDAGKTTLSENLLYLCGNIRRLGRVDKRDTFFDSNSIERDRGITIFSKQANLTYGDLSVNLLDTPGHADFGAEMERTLQVLDYALLLVSAADGVEGHTLMLWRLLRRYHIPTFIFVNKMDQPGAEKETLLREIQAKLSPFAMDFTGTGENIPEEMTEELAGADEDLMNRYLEGELDRIRPEDAGRLIAEEKVYPVYFGSALKSEGITGLLDGIVRLSQSKAYPKEFGAVVYKITREGSTRLTHVKITGGSLEVRSVLPEFGKVSQIRFYSGEKYETGNEAYAGEICTLVGLENTHSGQILGTGEPMPPVLEPVLSYRILLPAGTDPLQALPLFKELAEEHPELNIRWNEDTKEIAADLMGEVQTQVLTRLVKERFDLDIAFGQGKILYKETIANTVEGVGHFEPLRHYAEVHLLLEPGERGSGIELAADCREEILAQNWQRLVLTHLAERCHRGVLTGAPLTDVKITLVSGRANIKHTEGGDFRQATYRAVRQGLMQAESILLEPYYEYELRIPGDCVGRAMTDLEKMHAAQLPPDLDPMTGESLLRGRAAVSSMREYATEVKAYTKGRGELTLNFSGYDRCHGQEAVIEEKAYDPEADLRNTPNSVFCAHGAGFTVPWYEVPEYMHVESCFTDVPQDEETRLEREAELARRKAQGSNSIVEKMDQAMGYEEVDSILQAAGHSNAGKGAGRWKTSRGEGRPARTRVYETTEDYNRAHEKALAEHKRPYLLVDGYNVIFAWKELNELAHDNIDGARGRLLDYMCNYQALIGKEVIVVFDAYRLYNHPMEYSDYHNIHVVYTKTAETADHYIERFAHEQHGKYDITVATSDGLEQVIVRGQGVNLMSSRDLEADVRRLSKNLTSDYLS